MYKTKKIGKPHLLQEYGWEHLRKQSILSARDFQL